MSSAMKNRPGGLRSFQLRRILLCLGTFLIRYTKADADDILCSESTECPNQSCCYLRAPGEGVCGYGSDFCSVKSSASTAGCISHCDAQPVTTTTEIAPAPDMYGLSKDLDGLSIQDPSPPATVPSPADNGPNGEDPCSPFGPHKDSDFDDFSTYANGNPRPESDPPACYPLPVMFYNCDYFGSMTYGPQNSKPGPYVAPGICNNMLNGIRIRAEAGTPGFNITTKTAILHYKNGGISGNRANACHKAPPSTESCSKDNKSKWDSDIPDLAKNESRWLSCDEFPFNASEEGGLGASTMCVSQTQQNMQGAINAIVSNMEYKGTTYRAYSRERGMNGKYKVVAYFPESNATSIGELQTGQSDRKFDLIVGGVNTWGNPDFRITNNGVCFIGYDTTPTKFHKSTLMWYRPYARCVIKFKNMHNTEKPSGTIVKRSIGSRAYSSNPGTWGIEDVKIDYSDTFDKDEAMNRLGHMAGGRR